MDILHQIFDRIRDANRYTVAAGVFLIWMLTLADVDLIRMVKTHNARVQIETKMEGHAERIASLNAELEKMGADASSKERHARENYFMHKPEEDVFVFR